MKILRQTLKDFRARMTKVLKTCGFKIRKNDFENFFTKILENQNKFISNTTVATLDEKLTSHEVKLAFNPSKQGGRSGPKKTYPEIHCGIAAMMREIEGREENLAKAIRGTITITWEIFLNNEIRDAVLHYLPGYSKGLNEQNNWYKLEIDILE